MRSEKGKTHECFGQPYVCPFYSYYRDGVIHCEGGEGPGKVAKNYRDRFCKSFAYTACPVAAMMLERYGAAP